MCKRGEVQVQEKGVVLKNSAHVYQYTKYQGLNRDLNHFRDDALVDVGGEGQ